MDKYLIAVLILLPGFMAINTAEKLGTTHTKKNGVALVLEYATYTVVISLITMSVSLWWAGSVTLSQIVSGEMPLSFYVAMMLISVIASITSGVAWSLFLSEWILDRCNTVNVARGRNLRWEDGSLFHHLFNDGRPHFLVVQKDGEDIAVGFFDACSDPQDERVEFSVTEYPEYREEWNRVKEGEKDSYLYITKQTYVDVSNGLVITETQYPSNWLNDAPKKVSTEPATDEKAEHSDEKACSGADTRHDTQSVHFDS